MVDRRPIWLPSLGTSRVRAVLRLLLCAFLMLGSLGIEAVTDAAHGLAEAPCDVQHEPGTSCENDCAQDCQEHGCTPFSHHCRCCASAPATPPRAQTPQMAQRAGLRTRYVPHVDRGPPHDGVEPVLPPPIA